MKLYKKILVVFILLFFAFFAMVCISKYSLRTTEYHVTFDLANGFKIVSVSDLHSREFGEGNGRLCEKVAEEKPDIICLTGDMVNGAEDGTEDISVLIRKLCDIAPVYASLGNREADMDDARREKLIEAMKDAGAVVLEKEYTDIVIKGNPVRIGGTSGYGLYVPFWEASYEKKAEDWWDDESFSEQRFLLDFEKTDSYKILLLHDPAAATLWAEDGYYDVDLVLSGHIHGGLVRLPFIGGLWAHEEGLFPEYEYGHFRIKNTDVIISAGLGNDSAIPRFNNIPEVVSVKVN